MMCHILTICKCKNGFSLFLKLETVKTDQKFLLVENTLVLEERLEPKS
jgi:hypothetical protein